MLLIVADVMVPINRFSIFLQKKTLIYEDISHKFQQLLERIEKLQRNDGSFFKENTDRMELARRTRNARLLSEEQELQEFIDDLKKNIKEPFLRDVLIELKSAVTVDDPIFLAYDVFNIFARHTEEQLHMVNTLTMFYSSQQSSCFEGRKNIASFLIDSDGG